MPPRPTVRPLTAADRDGVDTLLAQALTGSDAAGQVDLHRLLWEPPVTTGTARAHAVKGFGVEDASGLVGVVFGTVGQESAVTVIAVAPSHRRRGIGTALLTRLEDHLRTRGAPDIWSGGGQPRYWAPGIDERNSGALEFFTSRGYLPDDDALNLAVDLTALELGEATLRASIPTGVTVRRLTVTEWPRFFAWMVATWPDPWGEELTTVLAHTPIGCFVAERDGTYLGFAGYDTNLRGVFGPMGSAPTARGSGIGRSLLVHCLADYAGQGLTSCEIGWVGPAEFYERAVGATPSRRFIRLRRSLRSQEYHH